MTQQNGHSDSPESDFYPLSVKKFQSDALSFHGSGVDPIKYYNVREFYREELAPTSVSFANMWPSGEKVAIKKIFKDYLINDFLQHQALQECQLTCSLQHPNIVKAYEWCEDEKEYSLILEYVDKATYFKEKIETNLSPIKNEAKMKSYVTDILEGLAYLHSKHIIHGDIKLENILLMSNEEHEAGIPTVKLCDFGLSKLLDKESGKAFMETPVGSMHYMAPEIKSKSYVDEKIDMWALGIVIYKMSVAYKPTQIAGYKYENGPIPFRKVDWRRRSPELQDLILQMLKMDPKERISAKDALQHPWFKKE